MKNICAAAIVLLVGTAVATPAFAQAMGGMGDKETPLQKQEKLKEEERKAIERDYDKTMKRLKGHAPAQATSSDPWASVRPAAEARNDSKTEPKKR